MTQWRWFCMCKYETHRFNGFLVLNTVYTSCMRHIAYASEAESICTFSASFIAHCYHPQTYRNISFSTTVYFCISHSSASVDTFYLCQPGNPLNVMTLKTYTAILQDSKKDKDVSKCENRLTMYSAC